MKVCKVSDCNKLAKARGLCSAHYSQLRRTGNPLGSLKKPETIQVDGFVAQQPQEGCSVETCIASHFCKGYCSFHYQRWTDYGDPNPPHMLSAEERRIKQVCSKCGLNSRVVSPTTSKIYSWCQPCMNENTREWNASEAGPRWRRYKLKKSVIEQMKQAQLNACAICGDSFNDVMDHVDHDNRCCPQKTSTDVTCGKCVRALLCGSCNQGLGNFKDNPERLMNAINYLRKWGIE